MVYSIFEKISRRKRLFRNRKVKRVRGEMKEGVNYTAPEFYTVQDDPRKFFEFIDALARGNPGRGIFLDSNHIASCNPLMPRGILELYTSCLRFAFAPHFIDKFRTLTRKMLEISSGLSKVVENPNVLATEGIEREAFAYREVLQGNLDSYSYSDQFRAEVLEPVDKICSAVCTASLRERDNEKSPLVGNIAESIRNIRQRRFAKSLSPTDRRLIATALADSVTDGRSKMILTYDRLINNAVEDLYLRIKSGDSGANVGDWIGTNEDQRRIDFSVGKVLCYPRRGIVLLDEAKYEDFFGKRMRF